MHSYADHGNEKNWITIKWDFLTGEVLIPEGLVMLISSLLL
jgi:hypothetical protein